MLAEQTYIPIEEIILITTQPGQHRCPIHLVKWRGTPHKAWDDGVAPSVYKYQTYIQLIFRMLQITLDR